MIDEGRSAMRQGKRSILFVLPTGGGKTVIIGHMLKSSSQRGIKSIFTVHRRELIHQTVKTLKTVGVNPGIIASGHPESPDRMVQVASIQTLTRRLDRVGPVGFLGIDEAHHAKAKSWSKVVEHFKSAYRVGLTATPERLDGKGLGDHFETMVLGPGAMELIEKGYLAPYKAIIPPGISTAGVKKRAGDYKREDLAAIVGRPSVTGDAIKEYIKRTPGKRAIAFHVSRTLSESLAAAFREEGVHAVHVDGETPQIERDAAMEAFRNGEVKVLCNVDLFGEGVDVPAAEVGIFLRPTCSLSLYLQQIGRVLRPNPGKECAYLHDHAGNILRHGLPDDDREWSLLGSADRKMKEKPKTAIRSCPSCYAAVKIGPKNCTECGLLFPVKERVVANRSGDLEEIDPNEVRRLRSEARREQSRAQSREELIELGRKRGYKNPSGWAHFIMKSRRARGVV
jgi:superfamily II DNA or RNA helicase